MATRNQVHETNEGGGGGAAAGGKLYYSISEVAELVSVKPHVLRYWETQFDVLHPVKNRAGNRVFRAADIEQVLLVKHLLYEQGFTISGARNRLDESVTAASKPRGAEPATELSGDPADLSTIRREIRSILESLR